MKQTISKLDPDFAKKLPTFTEPYDNWGMYVQPDSIERLLLTRPLTTHARQPTNHPTNHLSYAGTYGWRSVLRPHCTGAATVRGVVIDYG